MEKTGSYSISYLTDIRSTSPPKKEQNTEKKVETERTINLFPSQLGSQISTKYQFVSVTDEASGVTYRGTAIPSLEANKFIVSNCSRISRDGEITYIDYKFIGVNEEEIPLIIENNSRKNIVTLFDGLCYFVGYGVEPNLNIAFTCFEKLAQEKGDFLAQNYLGQCYVKEQGVKKNCCLGFQWIQQAAQQGNISALCNLGLCYQEGIGVSKNYSEALNYYLQAAEQGHVPAQNYLGLLYLQSGEAMKWHNWKQLAFACFARGAAQGFVPAQYNLGYCYHLGVGVAVDIKEAVKYYRLVEKQGYSVGRQVLSDIYKEHPKLGLDIGNTEVKIGLFNPTLVSLQYQIKSVTVSGVEYRGIVIPFPEENQYIVLNCSCTENGKVTYTDFKFVGIKENDIPSLIANHSNKNDVILVAALCYRLGYGVKQDFDKVFTYAQALAALAGEANPVAQNILGGCYFAGHGVKKNAQLAFHWFKLSADQGYPVALYNLAVRYWDGDDFTKQDYSKALSYFSAAAKQGLAAAQYNLGLLHQNGEGVIQNLRQAVEYYSQAAQQGYDPAQYNLGYCYQYGLGVERDLQKAAEYYAYAVKQGNQEAKAHLTELAQQAHQRVTPISTSSPT